MRFLKWLLGGNSKKRRRSRRMTQKDVTDRGFQEIVRNANRHVDVINQSLSIARESENMETKISRLGVAMNKYAALVDMCQTFTFLHLRDFKKVESEMSSLQSEFVNRGFYEATKGNKKGKRLEKEGRPEEAAKVYKRLVDASVDDLHCYKRLAIMLRKSKDRDAESKLLQRACQVLSKQKDLDWIEARLLKLEN